MTNDNYTKESILRTVNELNISQPRQIFWALKREYPEILKKILELTNFLDQTSPGNPKEEITLDCRLYCINNNITERPICSKSDCSNFVKWHRENHQFGKYCSCKCCANDEKLIEQKQERCLKLHGVPYYIQSTEFKEKSKSACLERFNVENPSQSDIIKEKKRNTCFNHHGVNNPMQSKDILHKRELKYIEEHGVKNPSQCQMVKDKKCKTCNEHFGCDNPSQAEEVKLKKQNTCVKNNGVKYPFQSQVIMNKVTNTMMQNHGVEWYPQSKEYHKKAHKRYTNSKYPNLTFDSSWEFKVYDFLTEHNIKFEYHASSIPYEYDGGIHYYHPDFRVGDRIVEVKGDNFFRINEETGKEEMYLTWRKPWWSDEEYEWHCKKEEAKHQCMIANNVIIIRHSDFKVGLEHIFCT